MSKVVISGFYGFHNIGDEAILMTLTQKLKKMHPGIEITVLSNSPEETKAKFDIDAVDRNNLREIFKVIGKCDTLISGGGSLLQDVTSARSIHYYLGIIKIGLLLRKKIILISHGVGPIIRKKNKKRVKRILNKVEGISVRDEKSYELLKTIGVDMERVYLSSDPVVSMGKCDVKSGRAVIDTLEVKDGSRRNIAIAIRQKDFREEVIQKELIRLANTLALEYNVFFLPFYYKNDTKIHSDIHNLVDTHVYFVTNKYNSTTFMSLVQNMDVLIGSRLHSLIFSLVAEVPFVGVSYDPKIENFLETIGKIPVCSIETFSPEMILKAVKIIENNYEDEKADIIENKEKLIERLLVNDQLLIDI